MNEGISSNRAFVGYFPTSNETGETGWTIGNNRLTRGSETASWFHVNNSMPITIKGTAIPATTLVSNTHLSSTGSSSGIEAQSFETGANLDGYTVSQVDIRFAETSGKSTTVKIRKNNADNEPGDLVATLTNPASLTADSLNTFTAQDVITLAASTTYWLTVNEEISFGRAQVSPASENDETGETGWSIGDSRLFRTDEMASWLTATYSLLMTIKGTVPCDGIWCATLTVRDLGSNDRGCGNSSSGNECTVYLSDYEFTHAMTDYSIGAARVQSDGQLQLYLNRNITTDSQSLVLHVGSETFAFEDANVKGSDHRKWNGSGLSWTTGDTIGLKLTDAANATGNPTISGVPQVGMVLTADTFRHRRRRRPAGDIHLPVGAGRPRQHGDESRHRQRHLHGVVLRREQHDQGGREFHRLGGQLGGPASERGHGGGGAGGRPMSRRQRLVRYHDRGDTRSRWDILRIHKGFLRTA